MPLMFPTMDCLRRGRSTLPYFRTGRLALGLLASVMVCTAQTAPSALPAPAADTAPAPTDPLDTATQKLRHGDYADAATIAEKAIAASYPSESLLRVQAEAGLQRQLLDRGVDAGVAELHRGERRLVGGLREQSEFVEGREIEQGDRA